MKELLKLCGFEEEEIEAELPRIKKAFDKLCLNAADIEEGKRRLHKYYDIELKGVRKAFRLCILEMVSGVLAREEGKKTIAGFMMPGFETIGTALVSNSKKVFAAHHSWAFFIIIGGVFGKMTPILEAAEKRWLKAGMVAHCANLKSTLGLITLDMLPIPDLTLTSGFLCETAPKTLDLIHEFYGTPVYSWDTCYDTGAVDDPEGEERSFDLAVKGLKRQIRKIEETAGFQITDEMLWEAIEARKRFDDAIGRAQELIHSSDPLPLSPTHDNLWMCMSSVSFSMDTIPEAIDAANTLYEEIKERVDKGEGVMPKGAPRVLGAVFAHHADPRLEHLARETGIALMVAGTGSMIHYDGKHGDPYKALAKSWTGGLSASITSKISGQIELCKEMNIDGVLNRYHVGCRTVAGDAMLIDNGLKKAGIPVLLLEWENFDPRVYNHEEYKRRLEVFKSMMVKK